MILHILSIPPDSRRRKRFTKLLANQQKEAQREKARFIPVIKEKVTNDQSSQSMTLDREQTQRLGRTQSTAQFVAQSFPDVMWDPDSMTKSSAGDLDE